MCWQSNRSKAWNPDFWSGSRGLRGRLKYSFYGNLLLLAADVAGNIKGSEPISNLADISFLRGCQDPRDWVCICLPQGGSGELHLHVCVVVCVFILCFYSASGVNRVQVIALTYPRARTRLHVDIVGLEGNLWWRSVLIRYTMLVLLESLWGGVCICVCVGSGTCILAGWGAVWKEREFKKIYILLPGKGPESGKPRQFCSTGGTK